MYSVSHVSSNLFFVLQDDVQQLGLSQVDLVLQHFPCMTDAENQAVWTGLVEAKAQGLTRAIGVSHFSQSQLESIMSLGKVRDAQNDSFYVCARTHLVQYRGLVR